MFVAKSIVSAFFLLTMCVSTAISQSTPAQPQSNEPQQANVEASSPAAANISLTVPAGTPLRISLDQRVRIDKPGRLVHGRIVETVYAFDEEVIPKDSEVTGHVVSVAPVSPVKRTLAFANGNFSPFHKYEVTIDTLTLPNGKRLAIDTTVSPATAEVVHLVSNPEKQKTEAEKAKQEASGKIQEAKNQVHEGWEEITAPGKVHRLKQFIEAQSPYRRQYLSAGTRFVADLNQPLVFGETMRTAPQLADVGGAPPADTMLKATLVAEVSSATASRGTPVAAILSEPLFTADHQLILPANSQLIGEVVQARPAHKLHHNGELRVIFERIETPELPAMPETNAVAKEQPKPSENPEAEPARPQLKTRSQAMIGNLEGVEVDKNAHMKLDEEGGAHTTDSKTRYLSAGIAVALAAAATHPDTDHGVTQAGGDPSVCGAAGGYGFRLTGIVMGLAVNSTPFTAALGVYGASSTIYSNFVKRGHDVVLPKDTPIEIGFGPPHTSGKQTETK